jgi:[lysine-biosynthesis-protein LysW]--L-2-aminoadipate ligase
MAVILVSEHLTPTNAALLEACRRLGVEAIHMSPEQVGGRARRGDVALARIDVAPTLDSVEDGVWDLGQLEADGVTVLNPPAALLTAHDKLATALRLAAAGLPHPRTAQIDASAGALELDYPLVVKPRFGSWGRDVVLCRNPRDLERCLRRLGGRPWFRRQGALVQEVVPPLGYDLRIVVAGGTVVGAVERHAAPGEWRTNVALGATRRPADPPDEAAALAQAAARALGSHLVGVDLLPEPDGSWVVLELNGAVDFTDDYALAGRNPFDEAVRALGVAPRALPLAAAVAAESSPGSGEAR